MSDLRSLPPVLDGSHRADEMYRLFVGNVTDYAIFMLSPEGRVASWNEGAERTLGYRAEEILGRHVSAFYPPEEVEEGAPGRELRAAVEEGRHDALSWRVRRDGSRLWASVVLTAIVDEAGRLVGIGQITRDLTERKEVAQQYEESRQRYRSLFEHNPDAVCSFDLGGALLGANPAAERMCGHAEEILVALSPLSLVVPEDAGRAARAFRRAARGAARQVEVGLRHRSGGRVEARITIFPIVVHGEILGVYAIVEDATERKRAEAEREELLLRERVARREAEEASHAKTDFLAVMSHELRTPLNVILGYADLLHDGDAGAVSQVQQRHLGRIRSTARDLSRMIEEILAFVRMESGREEVHPERVEMADLLREAADAVEPLTRARGLALRYEPPAGPCTRDTDPRKVREVLRQLLSNAVKFTERGEVHLLCSRSGDGTLLVEVRDTGIGILPEHLERIWEPFWQADDPLRRRADGAGLGLGVTRRLVQLLGWEIAVESTPGEGSTFTLRLPAAD